MNESGFGRFAGIEGLRALCLERSILLDAIPGVKTTIPPPLDYPIDKQKGLPFASSLVQLFYNENELVCNDLKQSSKISSLKPSQKSLQSSNIKYRKLGMLPIKYKKGCPSPELELKQGE